jgi:hypothetical protein
MKDLKSTVREFAQSIPDYELEHLTMRLSQRLQGDLSFALDAMSRHRGLDSILGSAKSAEELYDLADEVTRLLQQECKKKGLVLSKGQVAAA